MRANLEVAEEEAWRMVYGPRAAFYTANALELGLEEPALAGADALRGAKGFNLTLGVQNSQSGNECSWVGADALGGRVCFASHQLALAPTADMELQSIPGQQLASSSLSGRIEAQMDGVQRRVEPEAFTGILTRPSSKL